MHNHSKTVGILGGMGPYATSAFYRMLLDFTPAARDWDHLRVIMDVNPHIPSRSRHHLYGEASPVPAMIDSCRRLAAYPVDFIVIPCNSASYFLPEVQPQVAVPLVNIMQVTAAALAAQCPQRGRIAVLGGVITYEKKTYEALLAARGFVYVHHPEGIQRQVERLIERIKINAPARTTARHYAALIRTLRDELDVDAVILGCTEFSFVSGVDAVLPVTDSGRELARETIRLASG